MIRSAPAPGARDGGPTTATLTDMPTVSMDRDSHIPNLSSGTPGASRRRQPSPGWQFLQPTTYPAGRSYRGRSRSGRDATWRCRQPAPIGGPGRDRGRPIRPRSVRRHGGILKPLLTGWRRPTHHELAINSEPRSRTGSRRCLRSHAWMRAPGTPGGLWPEPIFWPRSWPTGRTTITGTRRKSRSAASPVARMRGSISRATRRRASISTLMTASPASSAPITRRGWAMIGPSSNGRSPEATRTSTRPGPDPSRPSASPAGRHPGPEPVPIDDGPATSAARVAHVLTQTLARCASPGRPYPDTGVP